MTLRRMTLINGYLRTDTQHNDTQHNDTLYGNIRQNDNQHNDNLHDMKTCPACDVASYADCRYAECHYAVSWSVYCHWPNINFVLIAQAFTAVLPTLNSHL